jgi:hypothetical protein
MSSILTSLFSIIRKEEEEKTEPFQTLPFLTYRPYPVGFMDESHFVGGFNLINPPKVFRKEEVYGTRESNRSSYHRAYFVPNTMSVDLKRSYWVLRSN